MDKELRKEFRVLRSVIGFLSSDLTDIEANEKDQKPSMDEFSEKIVEKFDLDHPNNLDELNDVKREEDLFKIAGDSQAALKVISKLKDHLIEEVEALDNLEQEQRLEKELYQLEEYLEKNKIEEKLKDMLVKSSNLLEDLNSSQREVDEIIHRIAEGRLKSSLGSRMPNG